MNRRRWAILVVLLGALVPTAAHATGTVRATGPAGHQKFLQEAKENSTFSVVTLPMYAGTSGGQTVWFVVTDASSREWAARYGANYAPKLQNAANTPAVMHVTGWQRDSIDFPFTPDFSGMRFIDGDPNGGCALLPVPDLLPIGPGCFGYGADGSYGHYDPAHFECNTVAGVLKSSACPATGSNSYSPLVQIDTEDGPVVLDAPQIANASGRGGKVLALDPTSPTRGTVDYVETAGLYEGHTIHYASFDSADPLASALENVTFAPALGYVPWDNTPAVDNENLDTNQTARDGIIAFTNGQTGLGNPERQGLDSAILDHASTPLNVIQATPDDTDANGVSLYSPVWDVHLATWKSGVTPTRQTDFGEIQALSNDPAGTPTLDGPLQTAGAGEITAPDGTKFRRSRFDVNCPIISTDGDGQFVIPQPN